LSPTVCGFGPPTAPSNGEKTSFGEAGVTGGDSFGRRLSSSRFIPFWSELDPAPFEKQTAPPALEKTKYKY